MQHKPRVQITPEGKIIHPDYQETEQLSTHVAKYQKVWMDKKREDDSFNLSEQIRNMLDYMIIEDEDMDIPEEVIAQRDEIKDGDKDVLEVFIRGN